MRVGQFVEPGRIVIGEAPDLTEDHLGSDEILVRPEIGSICGSDLSFFTGTEVGLTYPLAPGRHLHEVIGRVVASRSPRYRPGDRVLALPHNETALADLFVGAAARAVPVPHDGDVRRLVLAQPLGTVIWGARHLETLAHRDVVVLGAGPIGLLWAILAGIHGARSVVVGDRVPERLAIARELGATATFDVDREDGVALVQEVTEGRLADVAVEAVGHGEMALNQAIPLVRRLGTIVGFGVPDEHHHALDYRSFFRKNLTLVTSNGPDVQQDFPLALRMILDGRVPTDRLVTHSFPLERAQEAFELCLARRDGVIKAQIEYAG